MSKELSVLVAAYDDSDSAQQGYSVLKEELPKTGLVMDRSKVLVLATSDAPNEISVEHTGGGPIGMVVEHKAGQALKGRLAPGTGMIVGVIDPAVEGQVSQRWRRREVGRSSRSSGTAGMTRRGRRPFRRRWGWPWRWPWSSGFTPLHPPRRSARSPRQTRNSRTRPISGEATGFLMGFRRWTRRRALVAGAVAAGAILLYHEDRKTAEAQQALRPSACPAAGAG